MHAPVAATFHDRPAAPTKRKLVEQMAERYGVDSDKMLSTLKMTAFKQADKDNKPVEVSNEQMMMLLVVANEYNLNPFTREIYAFASQGGIVPIVSIDGWVRIVNEHKNFRGVAFEYGPPIAEAKYHGAPEWIQCTMYRDDREVPLSIREYLVECYRPTAPWNSTTSRMLRHRAYIQCGRLAFGFALYDQDEAERIIDSQSSRMPDDMPKALSAFNETVTRPRQAQTIDQPKQEATPTPSADKTYSDADRKKLEEPKAIDAADDAPPPQP